MSAAPPGTGEAIEWIAGVLWEGLDGVSVSAGRPVRATGTTPKAAEGYVVVPNSRKPRMLLPDARRPAAAAMAAGNGLRLPLARAQRWMAGLAVRSGAARLMFRDSLRVLVDPSGGAPTLAAMLADLLGEPVALAINVRAAGPYRKPVAQVLSLDGRTIAYAKIAWNEVTERNVTAEADALAVVTSSGVGVLAPHVRHRLSWRDHTVLVTEPMPSRLRRYPASLGPPPAEITRAVAAIWPGGTATLADCDYTANLSDRIGRAKSVAPEISAAALSALGRVGSQFGDVRMDFGAWHGDWVPWNLGLDDGRLWAWDWEYARPAVPLGFDLPHWFFQCSFIQKGASFVDGSRAARGASGLLTELGLTPVGVEATLALHGLEAAARYLDAMVLGAVPNPRFITGSVAGLASIPSALGRK